MDLKQKLVNVRRANRLLADYHKRVLDILQMVQAEAESVPGLRLKFQHWQPVHHAHIERQHKNPLGHWAWDFSPLFATWFRWTSEGEEGPRRAGQVAVFAQHVTDTGYEGPPVRRGPDPARFRPAEECETSLHLWIFALVQGTLPATWDQIEHAFEAGDSPFDDMDEVVHDLELPGLPATTAGTLLRYVGWTVSMADLPDEPAVHARVLAPLAARLAAILAPPADNP